MPAARNTFILLASGRLNFFSVDLLQFVIYLYVKKELNDM